MEKSIEIALRLIEGTGPVGAYIAAAIVALTLAVIVVANFAGLYDDRRSAGAKTDFMALMVEQYGSLSKTEKALREEVERIERENDALLDRQRELMISVELLRRSIRRAMDLMAAVRDGKLQPAELDAHLGDLAGEL